MTEDPEGCLGAAGPRKRGRPQVNALGDPAAGARLRDAMKVKGLSRAEVAKRVRRDQRTVGRWLSGEAGPDPEAAAALAKVLGDPSVEQWWKRPSDSQDDREATGKDPGRPVRRPEDRQDERAAPAPAPPPEAGTGQAADAAQPEDAGPGRPRSPRRRLVWPLAGLGAVAAVLAAATWSDNAGSTSAGPRTAAADAPPAAGAPVLVSVNGAQTPSVGPAETVGLWSRPSSDTGCDRSACLQGTSSVAAVRPGQQVRVACVAEGQLIRNGVPGEDGYYEDDRWLLLAPGQDIATKQSSDLYLSNVYAARDDLPAGLPSCDDGE